MNDPIERQDAIKAIMFGALSAATIYGRTEEGMTASKEIIRVIKALPSAEPKRGKWIIYDESANAYECSCCGLAWCLFDGEPKDNNMNYCPKCGADMRGKA